MPAPLIAAGVMVAVGAAGAIANYISSEKGRKMAASERKKLEDLINKLQSPNLETGVLTPPELKVLETYVPQVADLILEQAPELVTLSPRAEMGARAQDAALQQFQNIASGQDTQGQLELVRALSAAAERSGSQRDAILADMSRQGIAPSSSAYAQLQYGLGNQTQKNMFLASLEAALADRSRRDKATTAAADLGGQIYSNEYNLERYNDDIINSLNRRNTQARREWAQNRENLMNKAALYNMDKRQKYADTNLNNIYDAVKEARDLRNKQATINSDFEMGKVNALAGVSNNRVNDIYANTRDRSNLIKGLTDTGLAAAMMYGKSKGGDEVEEAPPEEGGYTSGVGEVRYFENQNRPMPKNGGFVLSY